MLPSGTGQDLRDAIAEGDRILLYGWGGAIVRISDDWSDAAAAITLEEGSAGEAALLQFLEQDLSSHLQTWEPVAELRRGVLDVQTQRSVVGNVEADTKADLERLDTFPHSIIQRDQARETFAAFMATCRGVTDWGEPPAPKGVTGADPDSITLACLEGWRVQQDIDRTNWWQTLAQQVPPGVLLLFLLVTLAGLYRYNMRLAGFHHSRADALVMLAMGRGAETALSKGEVANLTDISAAVAADRVEFGRQSVKLGAAEIEIAKRGTSS